jgi:hypothetical protein
MAPRSSLPAGLRWWFGFAVFYVISSLSSPTLAANSVHIVNNCPYNLYFWVVGPKEVELDEKRNIVPPYNTVIHQMFAMSPKRDGGTTLKIRDLPHYTVPSVGIIQVEYNLVPEKDYIIWDLSAIDCQRGVGPSNPNYCPFTDGGISAYTNGKGPHEKSASCLGDQCFDAYTKHGSWFGEPSWPTAIGNDVIFETCTHGAGYQTIDNHDHVHVPSVPPPGFPSPPLPPLPPPPPAYNVCDDFGPIPGCPNYVEPISEPPSPPPCQSQPYPDRETYEGLEDQSCSCCRDG